MTPASPATSPAPTSARDPTGMWPSRPTTHWPHDGHLEHDPRKGLLMELVHDFTVPVPADDAWKLLVDVEKIAPCLPGAAVTSVDGDAFEGGMKIKLGPISMTFKGDGELVEKDEAA